MRFWHLKILAFFLLAPAVFGDIIRGVVTDACNGSPVAGAKVSTDATHFTFSAADGSYELNTLIAVGVRQAGPIAKVYWDAGTGSFRWSEAYGNVSVRVWDVQGNLIDKRESGSFETKTGYAYRKAGGIHIVSIHTDRGTFRFKAFNTGKAIMVLEQGSPATLTVETPTLAKTSAADLNDVTYEKYDYTSVLRQVDGSQNNVNVVLNTVPVAILNNGVIEVGFTRSTGAITARNLAAGLTFVKSAALSQTGGCAKIVDNVSESNFIGGRAIEVTFTNRNVDKILVFPGSPFVYFKKNYTNSGTADQTTAQVNQVTATLGTAVAASTLRANGTAGLTTVNGHPGSYAYLAIANPATRNGVVAGWVTNNKGIGIVTSGISGSDATITGRLEFGKMRLRPNQSKEGDLFAIGHFTDARLGLEVHADDIAKAYAIQMKPNRVVYCTWYAGVGGEGNQGQMATLSQWLNANLVDFGFSDAQIDDGWQVARRRFDDYNHGGSYSNGMLNVSNVIKSNRLKSGLWFMPTAGLDPAVPTSWFLKDDNGGYETSSWAGYNLDVTLPVVKTYIQTVTNLIGNTWGFNYFKVDGMFTGMGAHQNYINDGYKTDDFYFGAAFSDPYVTHVEAYRGAWQIIRSTAPANTFIMGCTISQNMRTMSGSYGIMDALRIGPDNKEDWPTLMRGIIRGGQRYFYNGKVWWNDPDPNYVRIPTAEARTVCGYNAITGFLYTSSEDYPSLSAAQVEILKRTMPHHGITNVRPADFFDRDNPGVWLLTDTTKNVRRDVIGLFNFGETTPMVETYSMAKLGLSATASYVGFDFWANTFVNPFSANLAIQLAPKTSRILAVRPVSGNPMVLSTNRHVSQGIYDILSETWNAGTRTLSGTSRVVRNDDYELRIYAANAGGGNWTAASATASGGATVQPIAQSGNQVRVTLRSTTNQNVNWTVVFN